MSDDDSNSFHESFYFQNNKDESEDQSKGEVAGSQNPSKASKKAKPKAKTKNKTVPEKTSSNAFKTKKSEEERLNKIIVKEKEENKNETQKQKSKDKTKKQIQKREKQKGNIINRPNSKMSPRRINTQREKGIQAFIADIIAGLYRCNYK